jgi:hypothetical protein
VINAEEQYQAAQMAAIHQRQTASDKRVEAFLRPRQVGDRDRAGCRGRRRVVEVVTADPAALRVVTGTSAAACCAAG